MVPEDFGLKPDMINKRIRSTLSGAIKKNNY
jgi:hypothetical protein